MLRRMRKTATAASIRPTAIDPAASNSWRPVSWCSPMPAPASSRPSSAAESSKKTARSVGSEVRAT